MKKKKHQCCQFCMFITTEKLSHKRQKKGKKYQKQKGNQWKRK